MCLHVICRRNQPFSLQSLFNYIAVYMKKIITMITLVTLLLSCNKDDIITTPLPPVIILDNASGVYTTKPGKAITISPTYENIDRAIFLWSVEEYNGYIQSVTDSTFTFVTSEVGTYYVNLEVTTQYGSDSEEMRIDVVEREIPSISLMGAEREYIVSQGVELPFSPTVKATSLPTTYTWTLNGEVVSHELNYTFCSDLLGDYTLTFAAENEDGRDEVVLIIKVCDSAGLPFSWHFEHTVFNYSSGRSILLMPTEIVNAQDAHFTWRVDGDVVQVSDSPMWICNLSREGSYTITVEAQVTSEESQMTLLQELTVNVCPVEGTYFRNVSGASSMWSNKVYEYTPAPGQFINETKTGGFSGDENTPEAACHYAEQRFASNSWISLGGFGGYVVVGFDHSITNDEGYDLAIIGNSFSGSSEPGVVWVMQDDNGNGLPDEVWYELRGSDTDHATTIRDYAVTYYRPSAAGMPVQWSDNCGNSGEIDYLADYHTQDYYYPLWIAEDAYTLRGTLLEAKCFDRSGSGSYWVLPEYDWGYADNFSAIDCNQKGDKANNLDISNAIDYAGNSIALHYIDFVKVHTATNAKCGWIGENSTEVCGFYDCNMKE